MEEEEEEEEEDGFIRCAELKEEELERVGEGVTGPRKRRERAKSGSAASRLMAAASKERDI